jgi:hypothetical protein
MSPVSLALLIFGIMLVFMAVRVPIAVAMFVAGAAGYVMQTGWLPLSFFLNTQAFARFASYDLSVIPLFILMGHFATQGGISKALFSLRPPSWAASEADWPWPPCWPARLLAPFADRRWQQPRPSPALPCPR